MKNRKSMMMTLMMCFMASVTFSQTDTLYLIKSTDEMTGKTYVYPNRNFVCADESQKIGFVVSPIIHYDEKQLTFQTLSVTMVGIGGCNEKDEIIILFENGEKITERSWKPFNCEGKTYFYMDKNRDLLKTVPISKIRMTNGRTYHSYTGEVKDKDKRYFIDLFNAIDSKVTTDKQ